MQVFVLHDGDGIVLLVLPRVGRVDALNLLQVLEEVERDDGEGPRYLEVAGDDPNLVEMPLKFLHNIFCKKILFEDSTVAAIGMIIGILCGILSRIKQDMMFPF